MTAVGGAEWADVDAVIYFWACLSHMDIGMDERLLTALRIWLAEEWRVTKAVFVTSEYFNQQVDLLDRSDLTLTFELVEPGKPGKYLLYG